MQRRKNHRHLSGFSVERGWYLIWILKLKQRILYELATREVGDSLRIEVHSPRGTSSCVAQFSKSKILRLDGSPHGGLRPLSRGGDSPRVQPRLHSTPSRNTLKCVAKSKIFSENFET